MSSFIAAARLLPADASLEEAARQRIDLYKAKTTHIYEYVELIAGDRLRDYQFWTEARAIYAGLVKGHNNFEIAVLIKIV